MPGARPIGQRWLRAIPLQAVAWFYAPPMMALSLIVSVFGAALWGIAILHHNHTGDLLWSNSYTVDTVSLVFFGMVILFIHECGHLFAAHAFGISAELTVGHRLFFLVAVSRIGSIWQLPRWQRLCIYLGGIRNDLMLAALGAFSLFLADQHILHLPASLYHLIDLLILSLYVNLAWELQIFMKTDIYYLFADLTGRHDLPERAGARVLGLWYRLFAMFHMTHLLHAEPETSDDGMDRWVLAYTIITVSGVGASCGWFIWFMVPALITTFTQTWQTWTISMAGHHVSAAIDSGFALGMICVSCGVLLWSWSRTQWSQQVRRRFSAKMGFK